MNFNMLDWGNETTKTTPFVPFHYFGYSAMPAVGQCKRERKRKGKEYAARLPDHEICDDLWVGKLRHDSSHGTGP